MNLSSSFFTSFMFAVLLVSPVLAMGQQHVRVLDAREHPLEDAVVMYQPLQLKSFSKVALTDASGKAFITTEVKVFVSISKLGYITVSDTLNPGENKTYHLKESSVNLKDVVITGQFEPVTADKSVQRVKIIDRKRIEQQGAVNLRDLLTNELNIRLSQDAVLGSQMNMMGLDGSNVKILIDGVPVIGRMDGNIDISQLNLNNIERIEVIEGPMSVIYGTDALGGVINLITKKPSAKQYTLNVNTYYESVGTYNADASIGFRYKDLQVAASGGRNFFDGYSDKEGEKIRWKQWKPREQYFGDVQLRYRYKTQSHRLYSQYFNEKITSRGNANVTPVSVTGFDDYFITTRINTSLYSDFYFNNKATLSLINSFSYFERRKNSYLKNLLTGSENITPNAEDHDTTVFNLYLLRGTYTTNTSGIFNSQFGYDINMETGEGKRLEHKTEFIGDYAAFYTSDIRATNRLTLRQGIRFIYNTRYGAPVIPSMNLKYDLTDKWAFRASYARGFRAPSLKELSLLFVDVNHNIQGNKNLKAETSNTYNASLTFADKRKNITYKVEGVLFYNDISDRITLAMADTNSQLYKYINQEEYRAFGGNLNLDVQLFGLMINGGYSRTGRYNRLSELSDDAKEYSFSDEYRANVTYRIKKTNTDLSVFYKYNGAMPSYNVDANNQVYLSKIQAYTMMDASITQSFRNNQFAITAGMKNLFDVRNLNSTASSSAHSAGGGSTPVAMGRYVFTSIRINLAKN